MTENRDSSVKPETAYRTISEAATAIGVPQHVLRFWETRFRQLQPLKRGGNRRYYRHTDMLLLAKIRFMLHDQGLTIRGAQQALAGKSMTVADAPVPDAPNVTELPHLARFELDRLIAVRDRLRAALLA